MKNLYLKKSIGSLFTKCTLIFFGVIAQVGSVSGQAVLFDFDNANLHSSLPISLTAGGITAYFSATGEGYSIQEANVLGFTPQGFAGYVLNPNSIYLADLIIRFDKALTDFSIMYACNELGCDDAATMRVTAYKKGVLIGTNTRTTGHPGTWPSDTLACSFQQSFDSVVVHYDSPPPTCKDYGVIFMADNMRVTASNSSGISDQKFSTDVLITPNPVRKSAAISFSIAQPENIKIAVYDIAGRLIKSLFDGHLSAGEHQIIWDINDDAVRGGLYFLNLTGEDFSQSCKLLVIK